MSLTQAEKRLLLDLNDLDNLEINPKGGISKSTSAGAQVQAIMGNPTFQSQFNLNFNLHYSKNTVLIAPAGLDPTLQTKLAAHIFGNSDYAGGFLAAKKQYVLSGWPLESFGIYGVNGYTVASEFLPKVKVGDLILSYNVSIGLDAYRALVVINCPQVSYGTLLDSISSDLFVINMIRYVVDPLMTKQFKNQISLVRQSLFGRNTNDTLDPSTYITSGTYNRNIADIPIKIPVDKNLVLVTEIDYDVIEFQFVITVEATRKLTL